MEQKYKSVYFPDYPGKSPQQKNLTLAFGKRDVEIYETIRLLSSQEIRELLGYASFASMKRAAENESFAVNTFCLRIIKNRINTLKESSKQYSLPGFPVETQYGIEPIQATFKGGQKEPLHLWYPLLEGYSPGFVEQILRTFAFNSKKILDPFSGTGTTPLTAVSLGKTAYYCELNPLLQYLTEIKAEALTLTANLRYKIIKTLKSVRNQFSNLVSESRPDSLLDLAYKQTFGESIFFDENIYEQVLKARAAIDNLSCIEPLAARFVTIAILASLVPASRLIRRGDLRYKTEYESSRNNLDFVKLALNKLDLIIKDLERLCPVMEKPILICEDARDLRSVPSLDVDVVATSPPYLNGTNYFRNTKIELWFLRCLHSAKDLSGFRLKAVTAGINDVTVKKENGALIPGIERIVRLLESSAYDPRIPRMVSSYFYDIKIIFSSIKKHLSKNATILIDIGDSAYSNIHIPTDILLKELLASQGFVFEREIVLRKRLSRGGFPLKQALLVFRTQNVKISRVREKPKCKPGLWASEWINFKNNLPHQKGRFAKRNWGHPLHSLCSYQGKMKPSLAHYLVKTFTPKGGRLLDPMAGVATIPFEAALQGIKAYAFDISPAAAIIASAKLGRPDHQSCQNIIELLAKYIQENDVTDNEIALARELHFNSPIPEYFNKETFREILLSRRFFLDKPPFTTSESLVLSSLLHILHGNRPYALSRRSHPITPFAPKGPSEYRPLIPRLQEKVSRSIKVEYPNEFVQGQALYQDATSWWPQEIDKLDAIITSPPFFDSTRFYLSNWMRLWFCGWERSDFKIRPLAFVDERQKVSFEIYEPIFRQARERLKQGGVFVLHLGRSRKCDMAESLSRIAKQWFRVVDYFSENVSHCESHGIRDKGTVEEHQFLVLE